MDNTLDKLPGQLFQIAGSIKPPKNQATPFSPIFIVGFARSGKTLISEKLKSDYGMGIFGLDHIRGPGYSKSELRRSFYSLMLRLYPRGLVVEGDNLSGENNSKGTIGNEPELVKTIDFLRARGVQTYFVGNADSTIEEKAEAIHAYRQTHVCWTANANYGPAQLRDLAARSIKYSQSLRDFANKTEAIYLDIRPNHYVEDTKRAIIEITSRALIV